MKKTFTANELKLLAIAAMTLDHVAWLLFPGYSREPLALLLHIIGRLTCPIMCYFIAEGYHYTRNVRKYTARLFFFAAVSHFAYLFGSWQFVDWKSFVPFYYGDLLNQTSVMWPLAWGLVLLRIADSARIPERIKPLLVIAVCLVTFPSDWSCIASLCILAFGTNRGCFRRQMGWMVFYVGLYAAVYVFALDWVYGLLQMAVVLVIPLLRRYNGQRGFGPRANRMLKWGFYLYYPLHLAILGWIQCILRGG